MSSNDLVSNRAVDDNEPYPYVLTKQIGEGSFATVFRGYHVKNRKAVAVKAVKTSILKAKLLDNLESEIAILKSLNHRHITALIDIVKAEKNVYIVMDYCSGGDLNMYIKARGKIETLEYVPEPGAAPIYFPHPKSGGLDQRVVRSLLLQLANSLKFLRDRNLMHRDLKPQNLLLQPASPDDISRGHLLGAPILKVADFGFARILPSAAMADTLCGSPLYMAPEILSYEKYDAKADLWSVGAVVYEMSVGRPPFRANNHIELLNKINRANSRVSFPDEDPVKSKSTASAPIIPVPSDIKQLIRMLLKRSPVERASYEEFFAAPALEGLDDAFFQAAAFPPPDPSSSSSSSKARIQNSSLGRAATEKLKLFANATTSPISTRPAPKPPTLATAINNGNYATSPVINITSPTSSKSKSNPDSPTANVYPHTNGYPHPPPEGLDPLPISEMPIGPDGQPYDPRLYVVQDTFHFNGARKKERSRKPKDKDRDVERERSGADRNRKALAVEELTPGHSGASSSRKSSGQTSPMQGSDVVLKQEYVLVDDTRAVEFNRVSDEIEAARRNPSYSKDRKDRSTAVPILSDRVSRRAANGTSARQVSEGSSDGHPYTLNRNNHNRKQYSGEPVSSEPENDILQQPPPPPPAPPPPPPPPFAMPHRRGASGTEPSSPRGDHAFPPAPQRSNGTNAVATPLLIKPSGGALARALNIASKKLFGSPTGFSNTADAVGAGGSSGSPGSIATRRDSEHASSNPASPRYLPSQLPSSSDADSVSVRVTKRGLKAAVNGVAPRGSTEEELLVQLDECMRKASVLSEWSDKKFSKVETSPSKPIADPENFEKRKGEAPHREEARKKQEKDVATHAGQCISLYFAVMAFSQKAIDRIHAYYRNDDAPVRSDRIDEALDWARDTFNRSMKKVVTLKGWLPEGYNPPHIWIDRVIYDHALGLLRHTASVESRGENLQQCAEEYERALWMLSAIADDVLQEGNPYADQDRETIVSFTKSTSTRLEKLRSRLEKLSL